MNMIFLSAFLFIFIFGLSLLTIGHFLPLYYRRFRQIGAACSGHHRPRRISIKEYHTSPSISAAFPLRHLQALDEHGFTDKKIASANGQAARATMAAKIAVDA